MENPDTGIQNEHPRVTLEGQSILSSVARILASSDTVSTTTQCLRELIPASRSLTVTCGSNLTEAREDCTVVVVPSNITDGITKLVVPASFRGYTYASFELDVPGVIPILASELQVVAASAGAALFADILLEKTRRAGVIRDALLEASRLSRLSKSITIDELLSQMIDISLSVVHSSRVSLYVADHARQALFCVASSADIMPQRVHVSFKRGIIGMVATTRKPIRVADLHDSSQLPPGMKGEPVALSIDKMCGGDTRAIMGLPVLLPDCKKQLLAVLILVRSP
jgi:hypothetical protein